MNLIKKNKGVIIFYLLIIISAFALKLNNDKNLETESNTAVVYNDIFN